MDLRYEYTGMVEQCNSAAMARAVSLSRPLVLTILKAASINFSLLKEVVGGIYYLRVYLLYNKCNITYVIYLVNTAGY
jgi:hypothetical protein